MYCVREIRVSTMGLELEFPPPQLNMLLLIYDAPIQIDRQIEPFIVRDDREIKMWTIFCIQIQALFTRAGKTVPRQRPGEYEFQYKRRITQVIIIKMAANLEQNENGAKIENTKKMARNLERKKQE